MDALSPASAVALFWMIMTALHATDCEFIHARTCPTCQQVTRADNLVGAGNVPALTLRHNVGAENGSGAVLSGVDDLRTSCASRTNALSGSASNTDGLGLPVRVLIAFCAVVVDAVGLRFGVIVGDISFSFMK